MKYWEIIADNLKKRGWSYGYVSTIDSHGRTIWIADAHRDDGKRFVVHADEKLTAFMEQESAIRAWISELAKLHHLVRGGVQECGKSYPCTDLLLLLPVRNQQCRCTCLG